MLAMPALQSRPLYFFLLRMPSALRAISSENPPQKRRLKWYAIDYHALREANFQLGTKNCIVGRSKRDSMVFFVFCPQSPCLLFLAYTLRYSARLWSAQRSLVNNFVNIHLPAISLRRNYLKAGIQLLLC